MNRFIGKIVCVKERVPVIYFVLMGGYLYIGKTESHPVIRWGSHLGSAGTFVEKVNQIDRNEILKNEPIEFWAYECTYITEKVHVAQVGDAVRLTEHYLHLHVRSSINTVKKNLGKDIRLISDVSRSTPKYYHNKYCEVLAKEILGEFLANAD